MPRYSLDDSFCIFSGTPSTTMNTSSTHRWRNISSCQSLAPTGALCPTFSKYIHHANCFQNNILMTMVRNTFSCQLSKRHIHHPKYIQNISCRAGTRWWGQSCSFWTGAQRHPPLGTRCCTHQGDVFIKWNMLMKHDDEMVHIWWQLTNYCQYKVSSQ